MARREKDNPNWGGRREGAGRPRMPEGDACSVQFNIRLRPATAQAVRAMGARKVRAVLDAAAARANAVQTVGDRAADAASQMPQAANTKSSVRSLPGFDALDGERFALPSSEGESRLPFVEMRVACGFPSPAMDYAAETLSLSELMIRNEVATFFAEASGDSMIDAGIFEGDTLILDRSLEARSGDIVLAYLHGDFTLKRLRIVNGKPELRPENERARYPVIHPGPEDDFRIEGVLVGICRKYRK